METDMTKGDGDMDQKVLNPEEDSTKHLQEPSFLKHMLKTVLTSYQFWMITTALIFGYMLGWVTH